MDENFLNKLVRVGKVSSVNSTNKTARVVFGSLGGMVSGDLPVLQTNGAAVSVSTTSLTYGTETKSHAHSATIGSWLPRVGQSVVCLYVPVFNGDGFIIGGLS
ncbi:MAG: hypothetical protein RR394_02680 [Oscillospiraceae bacterium]